MRRAWFGALAVVVGCASNACNGGEATGYCASLSPAPTFCDDFDDGHPLLAHWDSSTLTFQSTLALDSLQAKSPPDAMLATVLPQNSPLVFPSAFVTKNLGASAQQVTLGVDLYVDVIDPAESGGTILVVGFDNAATRLGIQNGIMTLLEDYDSAGGSGTEGFEGFALALKQWMHLVIVASAADSTVEVTQDLGQGPVVVVPATLAPNGMSGRSPFIDVGLWNAQSTTAGWSIYYDNVTADVK